MINEGADLSVGYQKTEESATPVYRSVRSGLTDSTGTVTGKEKNPTGFISASDNSKSVVSI